MSDALDETLDTLDASPATGGVFRTIGRLVTLPFRIVRTVVRLALIPVRIAFAVIRTVVGIAADITYALWRAVAKVIAIVLGVLRFVIKVLNATIGAVIRLLLKIVLAIPKLVLRAFGLGAKAGRASAKGSKVASAITDAAT